MKQQFFVFLVVLLSVLSYANTFGNDFVWDDKRFIHDNIGIRSIENVPAFFLGTVDGLYRPLRTTFYAITYSFWGENVFGYHLNSLLWHSLISVLVFLLVGKLTNRSYVPLVAALIFAVHPVHTERVTNMTGGFDLLGIFFMLLSFYLYILFSCNKKRNCLIASVAAFVLALFSSEEAFILPLLILLYEVVFKNLRFADGKRFASAAVFLVISVVFFLFRLFVIGVGARAAEHVTGSLFTTVLTMPKVFLYYLYLVFIPYPLTLYRQIEPATTIFNPLVILPPLLFLAIAIVAIKCHKKNKLLAFAAGWFFITLLPFSNILPLQAIMADRYLYLPSIAACIALAFFIFKIKNKLLSFAVAVIVIFSFLLLAVDRNADWSDDVTLWEAAAKTSKDSAVYSNLGFAYEQRNRLIDAEAALKKAVALDHLNEKAHYNLGILYMRQKNYMPAADEFLLAIKISPPYTMAYDSLGLTYYYASFQMPEQESILLRLAEASFEKAIEVEPAYYRAYSNLGIIKAQKGNFSAAVELFRHSILLNSWNHEAYYNLGIIYEFFNETGQAKENFLKAAELQPENGLYREKLAIISNVEE